MKEVIMPFKINGQEAKVLQVDFMGEDKKFLTLYYDPTIRKAYEGKFPLVPKFLPTLEAATDFLKSKLKEFGEEDGQLSLWWD